MGQDVTWPEVEGRLKSFLVDEARVFKDSDIRMLKSIAGGSSPRRAVVLGLALVRFRLPDELCAEVGSLFSGLIGDTVRVPLLTHYKGEDGNAWQTMSRPLSIGH